jgi:hypothetical protein
METGSSDPAAGEQQAAPQSAEDRPESVSGRAVDEDAVVPSALESGSPGQTDAAERPDEAASSDDTAGDDRDPASDDRAPTAGDDDAAGLPDPPTETAVDPHPLYPELDLAALPLYGTPGFSYEPPALPRTTRSVTVATRAALEAECALDSGAVRIDVAADLLAEGTVTLRGSDCEIALGSDVRIADLYLDATPQRIRVTGGQIGSVSNMGVTVSDLVFDGVTFNTGLVADPGRANMIFTLRNVSRLAVINSIGRAAPTVNTFNAGNIDGGVFYAQDTHDVLLANNNFACADTATANGWFARIETGSNWLVVDNMVKVYFHKMIRLSDFHNGAGPQFDYLVVRGGTWMHTHYETMYDQMEHGGESDNVYIEGVSFHVDEETAHQVTFGAQLKEQLTHRWHATDLHWHARSPSVVSDAVLAQREARARAGEDLQYRLGSPTYEYRPDGVIFPAFRQIGAFADSDPEHLPAL